MTALPGAAPPRAARAMALGFALPAAAGACGVLAFAPFYAWPVAIVILAVLFGAWSASPSPRRAAIAGYVFGLAYFLAGVSWVYVSLHEFGEMPAILAAIATFAFCAYLAIFPALAGWCAVRFGGPSHARRLTIAAAAFAGFEWLRGTLFTGFAWLDIGSSQVPAGPLAGFAPWLGVYGVSLAAGIAAALLVALVVARGSARLGALGGLAAIFALGYVAQVPQWTRPAGPPVRVALVQGNVPQQLKWRDDERERIFEAYRRMILAAKARVIVVPETALPAFLDELPASYVGSLREAAAREGEDVLLGTVERFRHGPDFDYYNSLVRITGSDLASYRKRHLVPFGEYIPPGFHWVLAILHIPMSDFSSGAAHQPPIEAGGVRFGVAICYEDIFGSEVIDALPAAQAFVNVSNDAWFGGSFAADQHLQNSQMRALETGRWMVRSTNTGATAAIDERGRVVSRLPAFTVGTLVAEIVPRDGMTPYARWGNAVALALVVLLAAGAAIIGRRRG